MANKKISELTAASSVATSDVLPIVQGGVTKQATVTQVLANATSTALTVKEEGVALATAADTLDFVGPGVTASGTGATKTITIPGATAASQGQLPSALTGAPTLGAWYKADAITGKVDGDSLSAWVDSSGRSKDLAQATSGNQPKYKSAVSVPWFNGKPAVRFDGVDDWMSSAVAMSAGTAFTMFAVVFAAPEANGIAVARTAGTNNFSILYESRGWKGDTGSTSAPSGQWQNNGGIYLIVLVYDGAQIQLWVNGQFAAYVASTVSITPTTMYVGTLNATPFYPFSGDMAELGIYSAALSAAQRDELTRGLAYKYNLAVVPPF